MKERSGAQQGDEFHSERGRVQNSVLGEIRAAAHRDNLGRNSGTEH